ncbi:hypothetical protein GGR56DRAFT_648413 [Xylariaceae sp. FL0804]|nr:hypothetical protein GGR56DRAFT_648413 [Xylariaceae sp. FL0804]
MHAATSSSALSQATSSASIYEPSPSPLPRPAVTMEMDEDGILRTVADGGSMDYSVWPALLPRLVARLEKTAHHEFPIPKLPPPPPAAAAAIIPSSLPLPSTAQPEADATENFLSPLPSSPANPPSASSSQDADKENTPIAPRTTDPALSAPAPLPPGTLPPQIADMLAEIISTLTSNFPTHPPHTIQRLAELVLMPRQHYRTLTSYLHALDRVVHVTSGLNTYPLPPVHTGMSILPDGLSDGSPDPSPWLNPGGDEALGGALLTPIPWLQTHQHGLGGSPPAAQPVSASLTPDAASQPGELEGEVRTESTETIEGPNGVGSIETVSVSVNGIPSMGARGIGVTQGELLRQEQKAGVVPVSQLVPSHHVHTGGANAAAQQQQHIQARLQAQHQHQAQVSASPNSSASATSSPSTPSSATLEADEEAAVAATIEGGAEGAGPVVSVRGGEDDEKPHARGPEEIGMNDMGPQSATTTSPTMGGLGGVDMQGIDIQAAVGRKPTEIPPAKAEERKAEAKQEEGEATEEADKMDVDASPETESESPAGADEGKRPESDAATRSQRAGTPKREAEDQLPGSAAKKPREDDGPATTAAAAGEQKAEEDANAMDQA